MAQKPQTDRLRANIANEAARIIHDSGHVDYSAARNKAALRLGCNNRRSLPSNSEIEQALMEYQQLFHTSEQQQSAKQLRQLALEAMTSLEQFTPRLTGSALSGNVNQHSKLQLHLFSESPEQIALHLFNNGIPYQEAEKPILIKKGQKQRQPCFRFHSKETEVELIWFPSRSIGQAPLSSVDQKPEKRASINQLKKIMQLD
jgi:hypothetical protein